MHKLKFLHTCDDHVIRIQIRHQQRIPCISLAFVSLLLVEDANIVTNHNQVEVEKVLVKATFLLVEGFVDNPKTKPSWLKVGNIILPS